MYGLILDPSPPAFFLQPPVLMKLLQGSEKKDSNLFVCIGVLNTGTFSCLAGLNKYLAEDKVTFSMAQHNTVHVFWNSQKEVQL